MKNKPSQNHFTQVGYTTKCGHCHPETYAISSVIECECICHSSRPVESLLMYINPDDRDMAREALIVFMDNLLSQKAKEVEKKISTLKIPTYYGEPYGAGDKLVNDVLDKALEIVKEVMK